MRSVRRHAREPRAIAGAAVVAVAVMTMGTRTSATHGIAVRPPCGDDAGPVVTGVTLHVADRVGLSSDAGAAMMDETTALWRPAGLEVTWSREGGTHSGPRGVSADGHARLTLVLAPGAGGARPAAGQGVRRLAAILFVDRLPTTVITAYPGEVERLVAGQRSDGRSAMERPRILRDRLVGRVLGRSVAHELGHFVFGSPEHTESGLMRGSHRVDAFVSPSARMFRVIPPAIDGCPGQ
jgi:hypothetical protein